MTNSEVRRLARQMEGHTDKACVLYRRIVESDHPQAAELADKLDGNGIGFSWNVLSIVDDVLPPRRA